MSIAPGSSRFNPPGSLLSTALGYAERGWRVIPLYAFAAGACSCSCSKLDCGSAGKHPRTKNGLNDGTTKSATIRKWWERWPQANIGICTGKESGIWMLGPDGQAGIDALAELVRQYGELPRTPRAKSGSGGRHYLFRWPADGIIPNRTNHLGLPIDVRGKGGYFVASPSINKNGPYEWDLSPNECEPADAPPWLLEWVRGKSSLRAKAKSGPSVEDRAITYLNALPPAISGQGGHNATMAAARTVVYGFDLGQEVGYQILAEHYNPRCQPEWSEKELRHKCDEADTKPCDRPRGWLLNGDATRTPSGNHTMANGQGKTRVRQLKVRMFSTIAPEKIEWLWRGYVPLGTLTILDGDPGLGKSMITLDLAARVSRGGLMPPLAGQSDLSGPADVLILNAEDSPEQTIRPRLDAAGADVSRVHVIDATQLGEEDERPPILPADQDLLEELAREHGARLIVVDPFMAYLDGQLDAHRDQDVRRCLHRLKMLAENTGAAVLLVRHLNKLNAGPAIYRGGGSIGLSGAARSVLMVGKNPADEKQLVLAPVKCNLCAQPPALNYSIETADNGMSIIGWGAESTLAADTLLGNRRQGATVADECAELIRTLLVDGPKAAADMDDELKANGFTDNAIREGRKRAKVRAAKSDFNGNWFWHLPDALPSANDEGEV